MAETPPLVGTVHHVSFRVDDLAASLDFYEGALGCRQRARPNLGVPGAWLDAGDTQIHLIELAASDATGYPPAKLMPAACHVAFRVTDLEAVADALVARGLAVKRGPTADIRQAFVQDPSGNMIELIAD